MLQRDQFHETCPLILVPICTGIPSEVGTDLGGEAVAQTIQDMRMAIAINTLRLPAVAVPVGLPQVVQIIGPRYRKTSCSTLPPTPRTRTNPTRL